MANDHVLRQELGDAVVAEREALHESHVETVEIREAVPRLQVRRDHDVDVLPRRRSGHVPLHDLDVARDVAQRAAHQGVGNVMTSGEVTALT